MIGWKESALNKISVGQPKLKFQAHCVLFSQVQINIGQSFITKNYKVMVMQLTYRLVYSQKKFINQSVPLQLQNHYQNFSSTLHEDILRCFRFMIFPTRIRKRWKIFVHVANHLVFDNPWNFVLVRFALFKLYLIGEKKTVKIDQFFSDDQYFSPINNFTRLKLTPTKNFYQLFFFLNKFCCCLNVRARNRRHLKKLC